jgi:cell fate regulator YaaT (PSP1 superfamily)
MSLGNGYYVGVHLDGAAKSYYFSTDDESLKVGEQVVVETINGSELGRITRAPSDLSSYHNQTALKPVLRRASEEDLDDYYTNLSNEEPTLEITEKEVKRLGLGMNLLEAHYNLEGSKVTITYTSDGRVDFRELLRILAPQLHCRIELHQIAARDKAKMIGGIGICGLPLCCSTFLNQFDGISISRAKNQMLTLNIPKLSGHCGKLICCLLYEDDLYTEAKKDYPAIGHEVKIGETTYKVDGFNILSRTVKLTSPLETKVMTLEDYNNIGKKKPERPINLDAERPNPQRQGNTQPGQPIKQNGPQGGNQQGAHHHHGGRNRHSHGRRFGGQGQGGQGQHQ